MKKEGKRSSLLLTGMIACIMALSIIYAMPASVEAAAKSLSATTKNLYLGVEGKDTYDFEIASEMKAQVMKSTWYVVSTKGEPNSITVDSKSGVVTAKHAGVAYVGCRISLKSGKIIRAEAKVIVINNAKQISIGNLPVGNVIPAGQPFDFNEAIVNTKGGKREKTSDIIRWEIMNDTTRIGEISDEGRILPAISGSFQIRALSFANVSDYELWQVNNIQYQDKVTATSKWASITVTSSCGKGSASSQEELLKLLKIRGITEITLDTDTITALSIPKGDYSAATIILTSKNNSNSADSIEEKKMEVLFDSQAILSTLSVQKEGLKLSLKISGQKNLKTLQLGAKSTAEITGSRQAWKLVIDVADAAAGSTITSMVPVNVQARANATIGFNKGAEGSLVSSNRLDILTKIYNNTSEVVPLQFKGYTYQVKSSENIDFSTPEELKVYLDKKMELDQKELYYNRQILIASDGVSASPLNAGQTLINSALSGNFISATYGNSVEGKLTWRTPYENANYSGNYTWIFAPVDTDRYAVMQGTAFVVVKDSSDFILNKSMKYVSSADDEGQFTMMSCSNKNSITAKSSAIKAKVEALTGWIDTGITASAEYVSTAGDVETYYVVLIYSDGIMSFYIDNVIFP